MITSISKTGKAHFLRAAVLLMVLFILPAASSYAGWSESDKLLAADGAAYDQFGMSVSISGDYAIIGAHYDDDNGTNSGSAYIFYYDGTSWSEQAKLLAADGNDWGFFGYSVSISGDYAIIGVPYSNFGATYPGLAYIFKRSGTSWSEQAKLIADDGAVLDYFGRSVSISGDYAIVGAYGDDDNWTDSGSVYIFYRNQGGVDNWGQQDKLTAADGTVNDSFGYSVSISGDYAIVGAAYDSDYGTDCGSAYIFTPNDVDPNNWDQIAKLFASDVTVGDNFGGSVSISGDYAIIGAAYNDDVTRGTDSGSAYVFKRDGTNWSEQDKFTAADTAQEDYFGTSVSISGDYAIVGARYDDDSGITSGSAYIFKRDGLSWSEQAKLTASDAAAYDNFGTSVSISGDYAIVGAYRDDDNGLDSGSAYMFSSAIHGTKWHDTTDEEPIEGWLIYIDVNENGQFDAGEPSDITDANGNYVLNVPSGTWVVAEEARSCWEQTYPGGDGTYSVTLETGEVAEGLNFGNARPTEIHPSRWSRLQQDKLLASDGAVSDSFGYSVSISGDYAIVGARYDDDSGNASGSAYIFTPNDVNCGDWDQLAKLLPSDGADLDFFGGSVSISGDYAVVGAYFDDDSGTDSGSAYIFYYDGTSWSQQDKLLASDGAAFDNFGWSVSVSGDYAVVGAAYDDDNGSNSGSAYIFKRSGAGWSEQAKLLASDGAAGDYFGYSVSISGDYAIVGAYQDDDSGSNSGSAYIFKRDGPSWSEQAKLLAADGAAGDQFGCSVSVSGDYAVVGAYYDDDSGSTSGSAYIFRRYGTSWGEQAKLTASDGAAGGRFGWSVAVSGDYAIVGAYGDNDNGTNSGSAYMYKRDGTNMYKRDGTNWSEQVKLIASDGARNDYFGYSVSVSGDYAIIGAYYDDDKGGDSGSAYMFGKVLCPSMDGTGDCLVNFEDFAIMAGQWLQGAE